jgi:DNA topoisomerase-1
MRLRRSRLGGPGLTRRRHGRGFGYRAPDGSAVDAATRERIDALAIPPAWRDVWICPWPNGHIQAIGVDDAGRKQYLYHEEWRRLRDADKHDRVLTMVAKLPDFRERVHQDLVGRGYTGERVLATALRMLDRGVFRVGSHQYEEEYGTYGLATMLREHAKVHRDAVSFQFAGKGGIEQVVHLTDTELRAAVASLLRSPAESPRLLVHRHAAGWHELRAQDINERIKELLGEQFTAKDMRTWNATVLAAVALAKSGEPPRSERARRRIEKQAMTEVSEHLGNTPTVARQSYVDPRVVELFERGVTIERTLRRMDPEHLASDAGRVKVEGAVFRMLRKHG